MKYLIVSFFLVFSASAQTAQEIIDKYVEATGGKDLYQSVKSYTVNKSYRANAATDFDEEMVIIVAEGKLSRRKSILQRDFFYVLNDGKGWIKIPMGSRDKAPTYTVKDLNEKEKLELSNEIKDGLLTLNDFESKGYRLNGGIAKAQIEGVDYYQITIEKEGVMKTYFFDVNSGLLKREMMVLGGITHTSDILKFSKTESGLMYPSEANYINTKDKKQTLVTTNLKIGGAFPATMFVK